MKLKTAIASLVLGGLSLTTSEAVLITDFSEPDFQIFDDLTTLAIERYPTYLLASGSAFGGEFAGVFDSVDIVGLSDISLTGSIIGENPDIQFTLYLYNTAVDQWRTYVAYTSAFGSESTTVTLTFLEETASFTDVGGLAFNAGGAPGSNITFAFESLQAIPEPSVYALSAVALGAAAWLRRRRRG
ncbi:MAG TPA: PEP-CTERM sorting domain-containing protein [Chthoniobacteraceae bacterium]|nr:PEP-CTERM sorting domain-containing protein [Chthoniobacteraceae bacterium]